MRLSVGYCLNRKQNKLVFKKKLWPFVSICRTVSFIFKKISHFSVKHNKYVKERKIRRIIIGLIIGFRYITDFINFLCWLVVPELEMRRVIGDKDVTVTNSTLAVQNYVVLKIILEDWWFNEHNWIFYNNVLEYINKYACWHGDAFNFIFF